jgi:hypothetical protein
MASGPSLNLGDCSTLDRICDKTMVVNSSYKMWPCATYLYTNDPDWLCDQAEIPEQMQVYCGYWGSWPLPERVNNQYKAIKTVRGLCTEKDRLSWGGNSGYAAINLAYHLGAKKVILIGYDQKGDDYTAHWHEPHADHIKKKFNFPMWHERYNELAIDAEQHGLRIINATRDTALTCFEEIDLEDL